MTRVLCYFFFQAEDGIRDWSVTGVQTCALPIYDEIALEEVAVGLKLLERARNGVVWITVINTVEDHDDGSLLPKRAIKSRSEERRVGKEWRTRGGAEE